MATPGPGLSLIPEDGATRTALAQQLVCWSRQDNGQIDPRIRFLTCKGIGYYYVPPEVCNAGYGPFPFTSEGNDIVCDPEATHQMDRTIWPEDVAPINVDTCTTEGVQLATPTDLTISDITETGATAMWNGVPGASGYEVSWRTLTGEWSDPVTATDPTQALTGLEPGTEYQVRVRAIGEDGYVPSLYAITAFETEGDAPPVIDPPTGLVTSNIGPASVDVTWDAVDGAESYIVYYKPSAESVWMVAGEVTPPTVTATVASLTSETAYDFAVAVSVDGQLSAPSASVSATTIAGGTPLAQVTAAAGTPTATSVPLTWDADADASSFQIRWRAAADEQWNPVLGTEDAGATGTSMEGLESSTDYVFGVRAVGDGTTFTSGPWSVDVTATTAAVEAAVASAKTSRKRK